MPRGDKSKYSDKQQRKAEHIEESYKAKGVSESEAEARAWATVNKQSGVPAAPRARRPSAPTARTRPIAPPRPAQGDRPTAARRAVANVKAAPR